MTIPEMFSNSSWNNVGVVAPLVNKRMTSQFQYQQNTFMYMYYQYDETISNTRKITTYSSSQKLIPSDICKVVSDSSLH